MRLFAPDCVFEASGGPEFDGRRFDGWDQVRAAFQDVLGSMPDVEVLSADPDGASAPDAGPRGAAFAEQIGIPYVDSYDELFAWGPDAVVVTSENAGHR